MCRQLRVVSCPRLREGAAIRVGRGSLAGTGSTPASRSSGRSRRSNPAELQRLVLAAVAPYPDQAVLGDRIAGEERAAEGN